MDLSGKYSDLINDDSLIDVLNELDEISLNEFKECKVVEQNLPPIDQTLKTQTLSINSTRYDSETSSVVLGEEQFAKQPRQILPYHKKFDLHISKTLDPLVKYILESPINVGGRQIYFTRKKTYLEHLINETVESYRNNWNKVYGTLSCFSQNPPRDQSAGQKATSYEELEKAHIKLTRGLSSLDMNSFMRSTSVASGYENEPEMIQELNVNDVFVESGSRHELVEALYSGGMEQFHDLLDFLFGLVQNTKHSYKVVQTMDVLTNILKLMPELSVLLVLPIKNDSKLLSKGRCYFKFLVEKLKSRFGLNQGSLLEIYKKFLKHEFVPFYMNDPYRTHDGSKDKLDSGDTDVHLDKTGSSSHSIDLTRIYVMDRLINLVSVLSERLFEFTSMNLDDQIKASLLKKMKKYLFLPFLGIGLFHELFLPFSGNFKFSELRKVGYRALIAKYLYPPPPLYSIRLRFLEILELVTGSNLVKYKGNFSKANRRLTESESVAGMSQKVDRVLVNYLHLLSFGASFLLLGDFMKRSVQCPATFFGNYLFLMPHFRINYSHINDDLVIEENVYRLQKSALDLLLNLNEARVLTNCDFMNMRCLNLTQSNVLKRMLSLLVHYVSNTSETEIKEAGSDVNVDNEFNVSKILNSNCSKYCDFIVPYNTHTIASYLLNVACTHDKEGQIDKGDKTLTDDDDEIFVYNEYGNMSEMEVDVANFEEFDKITINSLNPASYYIPLDRSRNLDYKLSEKPLLEYKTKSATSKRISRAPNTTALLTSNGLSIQSDHTRAESDNLNDLLNRESTIEVDDVLFNSDDDSTNRDGSIEKVSDSCGYSCLLKKHMVCEARFRHVMELRKRLVMQLLETLSCHPPEKLGDLQPLYNSFVMKLMC